MLARTLLILAAVVNATVLGVGVGMATTTHTVTHHSVQPVVCAATEDSILTACDTHSPLEYHDHAWWVVDH